MEYKDKAYHEANFIEQILLVGIERVYETDEAIAKYCDIHYGKIDSFAKKSVEKILPYLNDIQKNSVLDLGCLVGRTSFELAKIFDNVMAIDITANLINIGVKLKNYDSLKYRVDEIEKSEYGLLTSINSERKMKEEALDLLIRDNDLRKQYSSLTDKRVEDFIGRNYSRYNNRTYIYFWTIFSLALPYSPSYLFITTLAFLNYGI